MDAKTVLDIGNDSWPLAMLIVICLILWRFVNWSKVKIVEPLSERAAKFLDKAIAATEKNSEALDSQTLLLDSIHKAATSQIEALNEANNSLLSLDAKHSDPDALFSSVRTNAMVEQVLENNRVFAFTAIRALKALESHTEKPEVAEVARQAIESLRSVGATRTNQELV